MSQRCIYYFVNGILTDANDPAKNWALRASGGFALKGWADDCGVFSNCNSVLGATLALNSQAANITLDLEEFWEAGAGEIHAVGHSNGCRLLLHSLKHGTRLTTLHLIAAADDVDCEANGLNRAARDGRVQKVILYVSKGDGVLALPGAYGRLGRDGPMNVDAELQQILGIVQGTCGHSDWVGSLFEQTMAEVHAAAGGT